jgi:hypothetical protein
LRPFLVFAMSPVFRGLRMGRWADHPAAAWILAAVAFLGTAAGARPCAGGWNDGSRLAAVESLIERGTFAIEGSVFVTPPQELIDRGTPPYIPGSATNTTGTLDRLYINGHFYSEKPAVVSVLMAGGYRTLMWFGAPRPSERPDVFAQLITIFACGGCYAAAVGCLWVIGRRLGLTPRLRLAWLAAFCFCTFAPAYTRQVNSHILQLGVVAGMCAILARSAATGGIGWATSLGLGTLAGIGFNLDFGNGPPLVAVVGCFIVWRVRRVGPVAAFALAALPWVIAGMWINYAIGGVLKPMNMVPEYSQWPGGPFDATNLTGFARYGPVDQARYLYCMLLGSRGFFTHNLPLFLVLAAGWRALRTPFTGRSELLALVAWCVVTWLMYGFLSNNYSGANVSVRWFVPFLAPGFWLLAVILRDRPELRPQFVALSVWGAVLAGVMWWVGPWTLRMVPLLWQVVGCALVTWGIVAWRTWRTRAVAGAEMRTAEPLPVRRAA